MPLHSKIAVVSLAAMAVIGVPVLSGQPPASDIAAGVFPPWWSPAQALSAAAEAGYVQGVGAFPFIVIVKSDDGDLEQRLSSAGSLLTLNPFGVMGCIARPI